jgi:hypothetical protein
VLLEVVLVAKDLHDQLEPSSTPELDRAEVAQVPRRQADHGQLLRQRHDGAIDEPQPEDLALSGDRR